MKRHLTLLAAVLLTGTTQLHAQFGAGGGMGGSSSGPSFGGEMIKLFGEHKAFSANLKFEFVKGGEGDPMTMPGKLSILDGKSRFDMDVDQAKGPMIPPNAAAQMKQMGMDKMTAISIPDKKLSYMIYPGLEAYLEIPLNDENADRPESDFEMEVTELDKETIDGNECVKNKAIVTDKSGKQHEFTVWNATKLKNFPIKIEAKENGDNVVLLFKDVQLSKPRETDFDPPSDYKKYANVMAMMQELMAKRMGGGANP